MEKHPVADRTIFVTEDGSATLKLNQFDEQFHSTHGAINESMHIYINAGLKAATTSPVNLLEIGFGTGLNAILTCIHKEDRTINYHGIEAFPLTKEEIYLLNYQDFMTEEEYRVFLSLHHAEGDELLQMNHFSFQKSIIKLEDIALPKDYYQVVYFDAFSPNTQPELWTADIFEKIYTSMKSGAVITTYCAKGSVKRAMKAVGFEIEGLPGPIGKREITRGRRR